MRKSLSIITIVISFISLGNLLAYDEPKYKVLKEIDNFEIREYSSYIIAETYIDSTFEDAGNVAHGILFDYISGKNISNTEMAMTIPVNQINLATGEEMEMTTPVSQNVKLNTDGKYAVSFVLPLNYTFETAPKPIDSRIAIREIPQRTIAVLEYSGTWSEENYRKHEKELFDALDKEGITRTGETVWARYNPPFWPWFLRRNEVQVEIKYDAI